MWLIYARTGTSSIIITKVDPQTLEFGRSWTTNSAPMKTYSSAFMLQGQLYAISVGNYLSQQTTAPKLIYQYDTASQKDVPVNITINLYGWRNNENNGTFIRYDHRKKTLYEWGNKEIQAHKLLFTLKASK